MSGTGRRRKPPIGEDGEGQQSQESSGQSPEQHSPYQTHQQPAQPQYDYDWRQAAAASQQGQGQQGQTGFDPFHPYPSAPAAPAAPAQPVVPAQSQPQYDEYDGYGRARSGYGYQPSQAAAGSQAPEAPQTPQVPAQRWEQPSAPIPASEVSPASAPSSASLRPRPRPEPTAAAAPAPAPEFEFEFDLDDPQPSPASPEPEAAASGATSSRPVDKDGYRPGDFAFVEQADDPDVGGWLDFTESRADTRAERVRKMRTRLIAGGVLVALVAAGVGVYEWLGGRDSGVSTAAQATKSMILFRLDDTTGDSVGDALMVTQRGGSTTGSATGSGAIVVIPSQMQIDDEGFGQQPFGGDMAQDQPPAGITQVSDALGVTPDGVWTIDETTFGIFVQELGGISLTTNTSVPPSSADPTGVPAGQSTLSGVQAVAYATYQAPGEPVAAQAARFGHVLDALLAKIPPYSNSVTAYLNQLALIPDPSLPLSQLSPILAALAAQEAGGRVTLADLPLTASGASTLNSTGASQIVSKLLGGTVKAGAPAGQSARVLVQDGTGTSGTADQKLVAVAQAELVDAGYTYNAGTTTAPQAHTEVEVASSSDQGVASQVAAALGLSGSAVHVVSGLSTVDDVTVVLGQDFSSLAAQ